ncbi:MAG: class I SAM-dependent methyltransferase [Thermomicrobiaceae bacterium]|nr:class I SAM-dependent methyltransferase [Thermomicrobiaceae bacterium]
MAWLAFGDEWDRWRRLAASLVPPGGRVLDLGCGTGALLAALAARGGAVVGLDRSPAMLDAARRRVGTAPGAALVLADARRLPFRGGTFTAVVSTFPAEFILDAATLDEVARCLRPEGRFVVVLGGVRERWGVARWPVRLALRLLYGRNHEGAGNVVDLSHGLLPGEWRTLRSPNGRAVVWVAQRARVAE